MSFFCVSKFLCQKSVSILTYLCSGIIYSTDGTDDLNNNLFNCLQRLGTACIQRILKK